MRLNMLPIFLNEAQARQTPIDNHLFQILTTTIPVLSETVVFGSPYTGHQDAKNKSLGARGEQSLIIAKNDEIKEVPSVDSR